MDGTFDSDKRKLLSALAHGSIFLSSLVISVGVPIAIMLVSDDPVVKANAKEAINFHFNVWLFGAIAAALCWTVIFFLIGAPLGVLVFLLSWIMPILAILKCFASPNESYRYPFIFRLV
jgi:uncharacterized protein